MFTRPLTDRDLYWIGYFRADGSISRTTGLAAFMQSYFHPVSEFAKHVGLDSTRVRSGGRLSNYGFQLYHKINSTEVGRRLGALGVKTDLLPGIYRSKHFWRGMIDGDGCICSTTRKDKTSVEMAVSLIASPIDAKEFQVFIEKNLGIRGKERVCNKMVYVTLHSNAAKYLVELLYKGEYSANVRKTIKAHKMIEQPFKQYGRSFVPPAPRDEAEYSLNA